MNVIQSFILGLIQGISEFLPISSSGHLSIVGQLMGFDPEADNLLSFNILLHVATLAAVFIVYRKDIWEMVKAFFGMVKDLFTGKGLRLKEFMYRRLIVMLIVATIPATIAAFFLGDIIENPALWQIGIFLIITAILLFLSEKLSGGNTDIEKMSNKRALGVGCFQALGTLPGISRSGSTIVGGLFCGLNKATAVRFSFLMSIPAILGALVLDIKDMITMPSQSLSVLPVVIGMITAAVSGYFAIKFLLKLVEKSKLSYFSIYCVAAGIFAIILNFTI
ncbi:MAG: undecaprenyl-diphosphatase UppP [Ruminococcaceae bacterium]|nr:undecaprenyl-diphosphatase UppP [Oscillospiraceae bacterium]